MDKYLAAAAALSLAAAPAMAAGQPQTHTSRAASPSSNASNLSDDFLSRDAAVYGVAIAIIAAMVLVLTTDNNDRPNSP